jgi:NADH dehydrogenase
MTISHRENDAAITNLTHCQYAVTQKCGTEAPFETESPVDRKGRKPRIVVVGSGFAGFTAARRLERLVHEDEADLVLISDTDHMNYSSLLPQVASGTIDPRHNAVALHRALHRTRLVLGKVVDIDVTTKTVNVVHPNKKRQSYVWDRILLTPGSVARPARDAGIDQNTLAFHSLAQAVFLRDHLLQQLEVADASTDPCERAACCTFVVVGAGYSGTELIAQLQRVTERSLEQFPRIPLSLVRWVLVEAGPTILREFPLTLAKHVSRRLLKRGIEIREATTIAELDQGSALLSNGERIATHTVVWTAGVAPHPLVMSLGLSVAAGRLQVDADLRVPGQPHLFAAGDAAAVPDLTKPGQMCAPTAQHATRQGRRAAENIVATLSGEPLRNYRHHDLGFLVDLGGRDAAANPLGLRITGPPARWLTRGYHLKALPTLNNKVRVASDWLLSGLLGEQFVRVGFVSGSSRNR